MQNLHVPYTYTAKRLLEHGPMSRRQIEAATGWPANRVRKVTDTLRAQGLARVVGNDRPRGGRPQQLIEAVKP